MKTVYFVRHGESEANAGAPIYLGEASTLTERGREQARFIASRCARLPIDALIASSAVRAKETAQEIGNVIRKEAEVLELFTERKLPREIIGKQKIDGSAEIMYAQWIESFYQENMHVGSGENFIDLKSRVGDALDYLAERTESNILVVTHGFFLHMTIAFILLGESLSADEFKKMVSKVWMDNTGLTKLEYRIAADNKAIDRIPYEGWVVRSWNDHAHLG